MKTLIITSLILFISAYVVMTYNKLISMIESVKNNSKEIDIQLDRRYKVFESLISVVSKYMDYEKSTLKEVVALRSESQQAKKLGNHETRMAAENKISGILSGLNLVFEQYPDLKASQNAFQLQEETVSTENKLAYAKQAFNDSIERYNAMKKSFFASMLVCTFSRSLNTNFNYWSIGEDNVKKQENYTVKL